MIAPVSLRRLRFIPLAAFSLAVVLLCAAFPGCGGRKANELVIGMELSYQPFEMLDEHGKPAGIGVDMARDLAASLHKELRIENIAFDGLITALKTGALTSSSRP